MHVSSGESDGSSSLLPPATHLEDHPEVRFDTTREVETVTFDEWGRRHGVSRVDLFWLDMQGFELRALSAGTSLLRNASAVYSEVSVKTVYHGITLYPAFRAWMATHGFEAKIEAIPRGWDSGNVLFVKSRELA
jgi:hypothetical protein